MPYPISLCMIVKNEAANLARCLETVKTIVQEIVIVDTGSTDHTIAIARSFGASVYEEEWEEDFSKARNTSIAKAQYPWVLVLDADEVICEINHEKLTQVICGETGTGTVLIRNKFRKHGQEFEGLGSLVRFFCRNDYQYEGRIHEQVIPKDLKTVHVQKESGISILHDGYADDNRMKIEKFDRNLRQLQKEMQDKGESLYLLYQIGKTYFVHEDYQLAKHFYEKALKSSGSQMDRLLHSVHLDYGYVLKELNLLDEGIAHITTSLKTFHDSSELWFLLASLYTKRALSSDISHVIYSYQKCLEIGESAAYDCVVGTGSFLAAHNLGLLLQLIGNDQLAQEFFDHAKIMRKNCNISM